ncbi:MAG: DNA-directed DNA polymerase [Candidatus Anstonellales archaeon]
MKAFLLDASYAIKKDKTYVKLLLKNRKGLFYRYFQYDPYFYAEPSAERLVKAMAEVKGVERVKMIKGFEERELLKVICSRPGDVRALRDRLKGRCYEADIIFAKRFLADFGLAPNRRLIYTKKGKNEIAEIKGQEEGELVLSKVAIDIEVSNPDIIPDPSRDPVIMFSYKSATEQGVITTKNIDRDFVKVVKSEKELIERAFEIIDKHELIYGYNSSNFDIPYLIERADKIGANFPIKVRKVRKGLFTGLSISKKVHVDLYYSSRLYAAIGLIKPSDYTLKGVFEYMFQEKKQTFDRIHIGDAWKNDKELGKLADYSLSDAICTYKIGERFIDLQKEMSTISGIPLFELSFSTSGQMVESLLIHESRKRNIIIPSKPTEREVKERLMKSVVGGYVKLPEAGIYDDIAVFDFRGLYPSIIVSYNVDPNTISNEGEHLSPTGTRFLKEPIGLIPAVLLELIKKRSKIKDELKTLGRESKEYERASNRSFALKILSNSFYGYLGYARSRWYSFECAESITAWGRKHIKDAAEISERNGFKVLYIDTDSLFILTEGEKDKVLSLVKDINNKLPGEMELELEGFYKRGIFVSKKSEEKGAKKKYALLGEDGRIKIRGFELVRRDWSGIAKKTQERVLNALLIDGSKEKAAEIVREVIDKLRKKEVPKEDLVIYTQLKKDPAEYDVISPEVSAAKKGIEAGMRIGKGSVIGYIVGSKGKSISDKAVMAENAEDYDSNYYIEHQVLPAIMKLLKEFGYSEEELISQHKQKNLGDFFG